MNRVEFALLPLAQRAASACVGREREGMTRNVFALHETRWRLEAIGADRRNSCCGMGLEFCKLKTGFTESQKANSARADGPGILTFFS